MNDRLETLLAKMQEALDEETIMALPTCRAALRQAIAELPLIRDEYERKIAELEGIIANAENSPDEWPTMGDY